MAGEIWSSYTEGNVLYATIRRQSDGKVYDANAGSDTFVTWNDGDIDNYDIPLIDLDGNYYQVDFPVGISAGEYEIQIFVQLTGSPADGDWVLSHGYINWDGTAEITIGDISTDLEGIDAKIDSILTALNTQHNVYDVEREIPRLEIY